MKFYNRDTELEALEKLYSLIEKGHFCVVTGQRRVGKTELLKKFIHEKDALYFLADKRKGSNLIQEFTGNLKEKFPGEVIGELDWREFIDALFKISTRREMIIIFDEFQYFGGVDPSIFSLFQKSWDTYEGKAKILLIVCGSYTGLMKRIFQMKESPLYGRKTSELRMQPLKYRDVRKILGDLRVSGEDKKIEFYSIFGGIPRYYVLMDRFQVNELFQTINEFLFAEPAVLKNEIDDILMLEFKGAMDPYYSIIHAIASGKHTLNEISNNTKININSVPRYLHVLGDFYGFIQRKVPVTEKSQKVSKKGRYFLKDNFFRFWSRFIYKHASYYEIGNYDYLMEKIKMEFNSFVGFVFEDVCKEFLLDLNKTGGLPFKFSKIGSWWSRRGDEIDIVSLNEETKEILFCECKWLEKKVSLNVLEELKEKAGLVQWHNNERREYFAIFSKSGFEDRLKHESGVMLFDLNDMSMRMA